MMDDSGAVLLARPLNWTACNKYNLTIRVTDGVHDVFAQVRMAEPDRRLRISVRSAHLFRVSVAVTGGRSRGQQLEQFPAAVHA